MWGIKGQFRVYIVDSKASPRTQVSCIHTKTVSWWIQIRFKFLSKAWEDFHFSAKVNPHQSPLHNLWIFSFYVFVPVVIFYWNSLPVGNFLCYCIKTELKSQFNFLGIKVILSFLLFPVTDYSICHTGL